VPTSGPIATPYSFPSVRPIESVPELFHAFELGIFSISTIEPTMAALLCGSPAILYIAAVTSPVPPELEPPNVIFVTVSPDEAVYTFCLSIEVSCKSLILAPKSSYPKVSLLLIGNTALSKKSCGIVTSYFPFSICKSPHASNPLLSYKCGLNICPTFPTLYSLPPTQLVPGFSI